LIFLFKCQTPNANLDGHMLISADVSCAQVKYSDCDEITSLNCVSLADYI